MFKALLPLFGLLLASQAQALEMRAPSVAMAAISTVSPEPIGRLSYEALFEASSEPGESLDAFAQRLGPELVAFSDRTGFEACAVLATDGTRFGAVVGTNHSHVACANFSRFIPEGMTSTGQTIHSHGNGAAKLNNSDRRFMGLAMDARSRAQTPAVYGQNRHAFSEQDLSGRAGYLATPDGLLHHDGNHQVRPVR